MIKTCVVEEDITHHMTIVTHYTQLTLTTGGEGSGAFRLIRLTGLGCRGLCATDTGSLSPMLTMSRLL